MYLKGIFGDGPVREKADDAHARGEQEVDDFALVAVVRGESHFSVNKIHDMTKHRKTTWKSNMERVS